MQWLKHIILTAVGLVAVLAGFAWLMRPDLAQQVALPPAAEVAAMVASRATPLDPTNPPVLWQPVDYSQGPQAGWWPKGESPLLAELVQEGKLPPVTERVGSEPLVWRGCDGLGRYGGTLIDGGGAGSLDGLSRNGSGVTLVKWSPQGYPYVPHVAKRWEISKGADGQPDYRSYTFWLRRGMKWSDGAPFTADDILYWWQMEANNPKFFAQPPTFMLINGKPGTVEKLAADCVQFRFPEPHGLFLDLIATARGLEICGSPKHYLGKYHPETGDQELIARTLRARQLNSAKSFYLQQLKKSSNTEHPRLWPWVYQTYSADAPYLVVRNPYYWIVDTAGNQLPYIDSQHFEERSRDVQIISIAAGEFPFVAGSFRGEDYSLLLASRERGGYDVYHWLRADRTYDTIHFNLNLKTDYAEPRLRREAENKARLLRDKRFRQALSLAINRAEVIQANYNGLTEPAQAGPGPGSYFFHERMFKSYTELDPERANALLDEIGLTRRDREGYRLFADGTRMSFLLNFLTSYKPATTAEFLVEYWSRVGVRVVPRMIDGSLYYTEKSALRHELNLFPGDNEHEPLIEPRVEMPMCPESNFGLGYANWWMQGGLSGALAGKPLPPNCIEPDPHTEPGRSVRRQMELYAQIRATGDRARQRELYHQILDIAAENLWTVSVCSMPPSTVIVKKGLRNVPRVAVGTFDFIHPSNTGLETFYFEQPDEIPGLAALVKRSIVEIKAAPESLTAQAVRQAGGLAAGRLLQWLIGAVVAGFVLLVSVRHPFVARRLLIMGPTLLVISVVVFVIIQLPPGDFLTSRLMELQAQGDQVSEAELSNLRQAYHLDQPMVGRYLQWMGFKWFLSFDTKDKGLLQGNLGRSMQDGRLVNQIVGDRITLTFVVTLGTILMTWLIAVPAGIYSAVRQYSPGDYLVTFLGFIGMCIPSFLLALLLMYASRTWFDTDVSGLFSARYGAQPHWDWPKFVDLLKHLWVPIVILGIGGTAGMIRVMRANLLDELRKPYVTTARAKGVRPLRLLLKYPVRIALNPFVSGIGGLFPFLVSGSTIVAVVLSLPLVGPLMLRALMMQDMYLAGSMLLVLSLLGVIGVLVSDLLLLWLDPRIRYEGGAK